MTWLAVTRLPGAPGPPGAVGRRERGLAAPARAALTIVFAAAVTAAPLPARADLDISTLLSGSEAAATVDLGTTEMPADAEAQFRIGRRFDLGEGVPRDPALAATWFGRAARRGHTGAQVNLGLMYSEGQGVAKDDERAVSWFERAAAAGAAKGQYSLGLMYYHGRGVPRDYGVAADWYTRAARQRYAKAMNNLGIMHALGQGVPRDRAKAYAWFTLAAAAGEPGAAENRTVVARDLDPAGKAAAEGWIATLSATLEPR